MSGALWFIVIPIFAWILFRLQTPKELVLGVVVIAAIVAAGIGLHLWNAQRELVDERHILGSQEYSMTDLSVTSGSWDKHGIPKQPQTWQLTAMFKNMSNEYTINSIEFKVVANDCQDRNDPMIDHTCKTVGEDNVSIWVNVPPGQVRMIKTTVSFANLPKITGKLSWGFTSPSVTANR